MLALSAAELPLITTIAAAFAGAWLLGILTQRLKLSPIVGYLLAGVAIGPHTPGFVGDTVLAAQLAEIGVMLLMFGVGLHFHLADLLAVRRVAIPGAIGQSLTATLLGLLVGWAFGWELRTGLILGMALSVASTVVLLRVLLDNQLLDSPPGHVAVGWLIVEDLLTVVVLVLIPSMAGASGGQSATEHSFWLALLVALLKLSALVAILLLGGSRVVPWIMVRVARLRSRELFTLTILVMAVTVAAGSQFLFGASMALGAFLAGMVVGQSPVSKQAAADLLPLRDAFAVLFFTSVGMLFDPRFVVHEPLLTICCLAVVLLAKPLAAIVIVAVCGYPARTGLIVAIGLAQVGEFSFILSDLGRKHGLVTNAGHNVLVACALVSITLNPMLMRQRNALERFLQRIPPLWSLLNLRQERRRNRQNESADRTIGALQSPVAVILGYGPVGQTVDRIIRDQGLQTVIVDLNMDTVETLTRQNRLAIYGDAYNVEVLAQALGRATHLVITLPNASDRAPVITTAKLINPNIQIFVRARFNSERSELVQLGADAAVFEETEAAVALARAVLFKMGVDPAAIRSETTRIRQALGDAG